MRDRERRLKTIVGEIDIAPTIYRRPDFSNRRPADGLSNLPEERHSHGRRRLAAIESSRDAYDGAREATIERATGITIATAQLRDLAEDAVADFDDYYRRKRRLAADDAHDLLVPLTPRTARA